MTHADCGGAVEPVLQMQEKAVWFHLCPKRWFELRRFQHGVALCYYCTASQAAYAAQVQDMLPGSRQKPGEVLLAFHPRLEIVHQAGHSTHTTHTLIRKKDLLAYTVCIHYGLVF